MKKNVIEKEIKLDEEWIKCLDQAFKKKNKEVKIDGFRKGKAPKDRFLKEYGIEVLYEDAADKAISIAYKKILDEEKIESVIRPIVDITGISDSNIIIKFTFITKPEVKIGEYKNLGLKKKTAKVTKKDVEEQIEELREEMADMVVEDKKIEKGDTAIISFKGFVDGKELEGGSGENFPLEIGTGEFIPGFEDGLLGLKAKDTKKLELKFPEEYTDDLKNKDVVFDVTIEEVKIRVLPELNEEFYEDLGYDDVKTVDELKKKVEEELIEMKQEEIDAEYIDECINKAVENMEVDINPEIIDEEIHRMFHQFEHMLEHQGMEIEMFFQMTGSSREDMEENMKPEAEKRIKMRYLIEEVAEVEKIDFTEEEVKEEAEEMAKHYGITVDELIKDFGSLDIVKYDMKMHKALEIIKENN